MLANTNLGPIFSLALLFSLILTQNIEFAAAETQKQKNIFKNLPAFAVKVDKVRVEPMKQTVPIIGRFVAKKSGELSAIISGLVKHLNVAVGDRVKKGDTLVVLSDNSIKLELKLKRETSSYFQAYLETTKNEVNAISQELRRIENLKKSPAFSQARLEDKFLELASAKSKVREAEAKLRSAEIDVRISELKLSYTKIKSPYNGVITKRHTGLGTYVNAGDPLLSIIDDQSLEIEVDVPTSKMTGIQIGSKFITILENGKDCLSVVRSIIPEENPKTRTRTVRLAHQFKTNVNRLALHQTVILRILAAEKENVLTVHKDAVLNRNDRQLVFIAFNGVAKLKPVVLGNAIGARFVVKSGLKDGEFAIVRGNERVQPEQKITFTPLGSEVR
ncbi:MAG: Efflux pump periplasmic linker BepF [Alphaproteobacteria bacterium MarineAlpha3_Bin5]|nr:hypothetical protein [Magnetovibrio sp.]PPR79701.1 MAG: Efflux pump periplasmic linker BepF [Alphaproteobacteria bacterium MarineAlpha3_Bin5]|tara:strand:+ start:689 stop:1855 length:1167 start_codon:yes stop_codon:yes gene_type:complete